MKVKSSSLLLELSISALQVFMTLLLVFLFSYKHINLYQIQWAALPLLLSALFLFKPFQTIKNYRALLKIIAFQLLLFLSFYGISHLFGSDTFTQIITKMTWHLGFFPWSLMLVIALGLRLLNLTSHEDTSIVDIISRIISLKKNSYILSALHLLIRGATNFNIALTLALISISIYTDLTGPLDNFSIRSLLITLILIALIFSKPGKYLIKKTVQSSRWLYLSMPLYAITLSLLLATIAYALSNISSLHTPPPTLLNLLNDSINSTSISILFGYGWWLTWASMGGIFIAHHSRTLTLGQMILWSSLTPLVISILLTSSVVDSLLVTHSWSIMLALIGISGLIKLLTQKDTLPCLILAYFPHTTHPKQRAHQFLFASNIKTLLIILFFSIPVGLKALSFLCCFISLPLALFSIVIMIATGLLLAHEYRK